MDFYHYLILPAELFLRVWEVCQQEPAPPSPVAHQACESAREDSSEERGGIKGRMGQSN